MKQMVQGATQSKQRAEVWLWETLFELAERSVNPAPPTPDLHPAVLRTVSQIELRLGESLSAAELAHEVHLSHSYLGRLFQENCGQTILGYIRARRMQRAEHLLCHTTLPIKAIAAMVGIPDLHLFNKTVRHTFGQSPRTFRHSGGK